MDLDGDTIWRKQYNIGDSYCSSITKTDDGGYLLGCFYDQIIDVGYQMLLMRIDGNGDTLWTKSLNRGVPSHIINVDDGFILSTAFHNVFDQASFVSIYHLDDSANIRCLNTLSGRWDKPTSSSILKSGNGSIYVTGSYEHNFKPDIFVGKMDTTCNLVVNYTSTHDYFLNHNIKLFPNPTHDYFQLDNLPEKSVIEIYDQLGILVLNFENKATDSQIDISNQPNGIYFVTIRYKGAIQTMKLVKY